MKCKFEHDGDCCNSGATQYMCKCKQPCDTIIPVTNADRIRAMSDEELKYIARAVIKAEDCPMGETECTDCVFHDLCLRGNYYYYNEKEWLQQHAEVDHG